MADDLLFSYREYRSRNQLPILLIMGIATPMTLQQQLHHRTTVCLSTKSFQSPPSVTLLNDLIEKLFMQDSAFKIGPRLMQQLLDAFLYHDLSLNSFMHRIQLICMQHFITLPPSALCCSVSRVPVSFFQITPVTVVYLWRIATSKSPFAGASKEFHIRRPWSLPPTAIVHEIRGEQPFQSQSANRWQIVSSISTKIDSSKFDHLNENVKS